jgi:hypothetical protein
VVQVVSSMQSIQNEAKEGTVSLKDLKRIYSSLKNFYKTATSL